MDPHNVMLENFKASDSELIKFGRKELCETMCSAAWPGIFTTGHDHTLCNWSRGTRYELELCTSHDHAMDILYSTLKRAFASAFKSCIATLRILRLSSLTGQQTDKTPKVQNWYYLAAMPALAACKNCCSFCRRASISSVCISPWGPSGGLKLLCWSTCSSCTTYNKPVSFVSMYWFQEHA